MIYKSSKAHLSDIEEKEVHEKMSSIFDTREKGFHSKVA